MKKIIALVLLVLSIVSLISCSGNSFAEDSEKPVNTTSGNTKVETSTFEQPVDVTSKNESLAVTYYSITSEEREMLAKIAQLEASICSKECQRAVVSVIFNRLHSGKWRKDMNNDGQITLYDIIYYPNAFTPVLCGKMDNCVPTQRDYDAVDYVLANGVTVPTEVRYFRTDHDFTWDNYANYCVIDNVYFGYFTNWEQGVW